MLINNIYIYIINIKLGARSKFKCYNNPLHVHYVCEGECVCVYVWGCVCVRHIYIYIYMNKLPVCELLYMRHWQDSADIIQQI